MDKLLSMKKTNKIEKPPLTSASVYSEFFGEIVTCDVTRTSVLAFVSSVCSPLTSYSLSSTMQQQHHAAAAAPCSSTTQQYHAAAPRSSTT